MDFKNLLQQAGGVAGAVNPSYQEGVQMALKEKQRKKYQVLMQSPTMQRAMQELLRENAPLGMQLLQGMPQEKRDPWKMMELLTPQQPDQPNTLVEALLSGQITEEDYKRIKSAGRQPRQPSQFVVWYSLWKRDFIQRNGRPPNESELLKAVEKHGRRPLFGGLFDLQDLNKDTGETGIESKYSIKRKE